MGQGVCRQNYDEEQQLANDDADPTVYPRVSTALHNMEFDRERADGGKSATEAIDEALKSGTGVGRHVWIFVLQDVEHAQQSRSKDIGRHRAERDLLHHCVHVDGEEVT